ncbi:MAG: TatD family hydrolase [Candidatus Nanohaloarchaea archaeon]|nr:TatD family hydrolase [Candidatus Nanohaloarchaea archaeon]
MKLIDNHAHLNFQKFDGRREEVIEECRDKLKAVINAGTSPWQDGEGLELGKRHPNFIYPCIGMHPTKLDRVDQEDLESIKERIREEKERIVAVGEIGLDYYHAKERGKRKRQEEFFKPLLELGEEMGKPVVIHSRDAEKRAVEVLEDYSPAEVIMHCFNGNLDLVEESLDREYWISISTQVLYSNRVQNIAEKTPVDRMLLETDSPFLYPGDEANKPWKVHESLEKIAEIKGMAEKELGRQINRNTERAYRTEF